MEDVFVGQLMSAPVLTIDAETTVAAAGRAMTEEGIKSVVVIDEDCHAEGILTSTDFVRIAGEERDPTETSVAAYMTTDILTTTAGAAIRDVARLMRDEEISHLPVVDEDDQVVGMLSATDLTAYLSGLAEIAAGT
jgi:CBS domain-containing protein